MRCRLAAATLLAACCPTLEAQEPTTPGPIVEVPAPLPPPPPGAETIDEGTFVMTIKGQPAGRESFAIRKSDVLTIEHDSTLNVAGDDQGSRGTLVLGLDWKPRSGSFKRKAGGAEVEATLSAGPPLSVTFEVAGKKDTANASRDVDLYFGDNVMSHLSVLCSLSPEAAVRHVFPGAEVKVAAATGAPEAAPVAGVARRTIDLGGALSADLYCQGAKLIGVDAPLQSFTAARAGSEELVDQLRRKERTKPALAEGLVELQRKIEVPAGKDVEAASLACSLVVPATHAEIKARVTSGPQAALPAVLFLTGSGAQDRDEDTVGPGGLKLAIFKVMANELGKAGIASLRCDDRGTAASTGDLKKASLPTFASDAVALVAALRAEPAIDPKRVGLVGHSEGAVVAPVVASADRKVKALVLMAGPGRPVDVLILEQLERSLQRAGVSKDQIETELTKVRGVFAAIRKGEPIATDVPEVQRAELDGSRVWLKGFLDHDPAVTARKLKRVAVLIAQGDKDQQVSVADAEVLKAAFAKAGNRKVEYKVYPNHNHLFAKSETGNPSEYADATAVVEPGFIADVVAFLKKRL